MGKKNDIKLGCKNELNTEYHIIFKGHESIGKHKCRNSNGFNKPRTVILNKRIIDKKWLNDMILAHNSKDNDQAITDDRMFAIYYTLIYLKPNTTEYDLSINRLTEAFHTSELIKVLNNYMNSNGYRLRYSYKATNYLNRNNIKYFHGYKRFFFKYIAIRTPIYIYRFAIKRYKKNIIFLNKIKNRNRATVLQKESSLEKCKNYHVDNSASSCLFFYGEKLKNKYFIKDCEIKQLDSIKREKNASKLLQRFKKDFLHDLAKEDDSYLILPFKDSPTLDNFMKKNKVGTDFVKSLIHFGESVLDELYSVKLIHRDIRPENILVSQEGNGKNTFKLIDFGCSISQDNQNLLDNKIFKYDFHTAGVHYRAGIKTWDDAGSFYTMIKKIMDDNNIDDEKMLNGIERRISRLYYTEQ